VIARIVALVSVAIFLLGIVVLCADPDRRTIEGQRWLARILIVTAILGIASTSLFH